MRLYLASPLGFSEAGRLFKNQSLEPLIRRLGHEVIDPWAHTDGAELAAIEALPAGDGRMAAWRALNARIGAANAAAIRDCEVMVAVLDGVDVDSGTAAEIGFAFALGRRIVGYRGDFRLSADNEGGVVNLQVEHFVRASGGTIARDLDGLAAALEAAAA